MSETEPLQPDLEAAIEPLAAMVHAAWAEQRANAGWRYSQRRDEGARLSPQLVPYETLPEEERELDRVTVRRTLAGLAELGYRLELGPAGDTPAAREQVLTQAERLISSARPLPAYDLTKRWLHLHPGDREFVLLNARALRRCGALQRALNALESLGASPDADGERRGLLAAVHKESFILSRGSADGLEHLRLAQRLYQEVFEESRGTQFWHGINAATLALLLGRQELADHLAERTWNACALPGADGEAAYWLRATRGEAALVQGRFALAAAEYQEAMRIAGDRSGDMASTRRNATLLLDALRADAGDRLSIERALQPPAVVVFAGHRLSPANLPAPRFPPTIEADVRTEIDARLGDFGAGFGFGGAAPGAEILFLEAMLERPSGIANVVLPWPAKEFASTHFEGVGASWLQRFESLLGSGAAEPRVHHVVSASSSVGVDRVLYERFASRLSFGLASLQAKLLDVRVVPLVVWDRVRGPGQDRGVVELIDHWASLGVELSAENIIDAERIMRRQGASRGMLAVGAAEATPRSTENFRVMAILFADVEDYSRIPEQSLPSFVEYFVGGIAGRLGLQSFRPESIRRIGDGLLMVFSDVRHAGLCALELVDWAAGHSRAGPDGETFWSRVGLPREMRLRVALHAGPVFECVDPLTRTATFEGAHINYAARIEPVTPGNQVYASEAFAALAASSPQPCEDFLCEYVGRTSLAKRTGDYPLYHVRRRSPPASAA